MKQEKPLYIKIMRDIEKKILNGDYNVGDRLPTETEVAKQYGVSRITSKRAFDELVRDGYIQKIKGSGSYISHIREWKTTLYQKKSDINVVDFIIPFNSSLGRCIEIINGANDFFHSKNYVLRIQNAEQDYLIERNLILQSSHSVAKGIIYYPKHGKKNLDVLQAIIMDNSRIIFVDKYFTELNASSVVSDNFIGAKLATQHLIDNGHTNIAFVSDLAMESASSVGDRFRGYCSALQDNNIEIRHNNYFLNFCDETISGHTDLFEYPSKRYSEHLKRPIEKLLEKRESITAIQAVNDYLAIEIMRVAMQMGIRVPEELSFVGFDNVEISQHIDVPLTTIDQDFYEMGQVAAELLYSKILGNTEVAKRIIPVRLIERNSVSKKNI